jgi:hypothetical protein
MKARLPLKRTAGNGENYPMPVVRLRIRDRYGTYVELNFRVDTQADVTTIPLRTAQRQAIPFTTARPGFSRGIAGKVKKYRRVVRLLIAGRQHEWPCDFTEPALDLESGQALPELIPVLGRVGFLGEYAIEIDTEFLIITRLGPIRRLLRRFLHSIWERFNLVHPLDKAL